MNKEVDQNGNKYGSDTDDPEWNLIEGTRNQSLDGSVNLCNPHIKTMNQDILYHLGLDTVNHNLREMFHDVKVVCMGGTPNRMKDFAHCVMKEIGYKLPTGAQLQDISASANRFAMYKVGPVLSISHGMGVPSLSILLHEIIKLVYYAKCKDPVFIRVGTCGGVGVKGGTVIMTDEAVDGMLKNTHELAILGKLVNRPAILDQNLAREMKELSTSSDEFETVLGKTMCAHDFYEGQGRTDGAFCDYTENDKMEYLRKIHAFGVRNIEMECTLFAALTHQAGIRAAICCVAFVNRLDPDGDQVKVSTKKELKNEWETHPQILVSRYIKKHLG